MNKDFLNGVLSAPQLVVNSVGCYDAGPWSVEWSLITTEEEPCEGDGCWLALRNSEGHIEYWKEFEWDGKSDFTRIWVVASQQTDFQGFIVESLANGEKDSESASFLDPSAFDADMLRQPFGEMAKTKDVKFSFDEWRIAS